MGGQGSTMSHRITGGVETSQQCRNGYATFRSSRFGLSRFGLAVLVPGHFLFVGKSKVKLTFRYPCNCPYR